MDSNGSHCQENDNVIKNSVYRIYFASSIPFHKQRVQSDRCDSTETI